MADYDSIGGGVTGAVSGGASGVMAGSAFGPVGMVVGGLLGGLFGSKKTKVQRPPSYSQMMNYNLDAQSGIQNKLLGLESEYRPRYQTLQEQTLARQLYGGDGTYGYIDQLTRANEALAGVQDKAARTYMGTLAGLTPMARSMMLTPQAAAMQQSLMSQAQAGIDAGTGLTAQDSRQAFQTANQAMAMRGMSGRQAVAAGVLSNYGLGLQRQDRARQFAGNVISQDTALQSAAMQMAGGAMGQYNAGGAFMGQANQMLGQYQPQIFQPESQMGAQAQGMQYQHNMGVAMAKQQSQANMLSSLGALGSFAAMNPNLFSFGGNGPTSMLGFGTNVGGNTLGNIGGNFNSFGGTVGATGYNIGTTTLGNMGTNYGFGANSGLSLGGISAGGWN